MSSKKTRLSYSVLCVLALLLVGYCVWLWVFLATPLKKDVRLLAHKNVDQTVQLLGEPTIRKKYPSREYARWQYDEGNIIQIIEIYYIKNKDRRRQYPSGVCSSNQRFIGKVRYFMLKQCLNDHGIVSKRLFVWYFDDFTLSESLNLSYPPLLEEEHAH